MNYGNRLGVLLAVLGLVAVCASAAPKQQQQPQEVTPNESTSKADTRMVDLLDFTNYKKLFKKSYSGLLEEAVRFKYFIASALRTTAAAIKYRFRLINYYLSLNHMSDWTREEFEELKNKAFAEWAKSFGGHRGQQSPAPPPKSSQSQLVPGTREDVAQEIRELVDKHKGEPVYEQLGELMGAKSIGQEHERRKRETSEDKPLPPRELPIEKLINAGETEKSAEGWDEHLLNIPSNNPLFVPAEHSTQGFRETQLPVAWHSFEAQDRGLYDLEGLMSSIDVTRVNRILIGPPVLDQARVDKADRVIIDLRETGCIAPVRYQQDCGSCYAFATVTIMEYLHCKNTGKKVTFSEQYMVDCGRHVGLNGCNGGSPVLLPNFVHNFGLYPSALYPYRNNEGQCPYDEDSVDLGQTGYIRSDEFANSAMISNEFWGDALEFGPLLIGAYDYCGSDFTGYGGGVLMGNCHGNPSHAVVLVGHGRQDGRDYWLIRNSWGSNWGEGGYIKVDKESNCIWRNFGFAFGASNPADSDKITFVENVGAVSKLISVQGQPENDNNLNGLGV